MHRADLRQDTGRVGGGPGRHSLGIEKVTVLGLDHQGGVGVGGQLGELLMKHLDLAHVGEEVIEGLALHHGL